MRKFTKHAAVAIAASTMAVAAPASATIFEYEMTNGDVLTIDNEAGTGTWVGNNIDVAFAGSDMIGFQGGSNPSFSFTLTEMTGTRVIGGQEYTPTRTNGSRFHPWMMKSTGNNNNKINLWSWWGDPVVAGDYIKKIGDTRIVDVPAPGMLALLGLALAAIGFGRRRRTSAAA